VRAAAYPGLAAGRPPSGVRSDVARASVSDLRAYYERWYAPNNAELVVAGDVDHNRVFALARRYFAAIPRRRVTPRPAAHPQAATGKVVEAEFPFPFEVLDLAYAVPGDTEPGEPAISALAAVIPNQRGPFYQALVQSNIALQINADSDTQLRGGLMHVYIVLNSGHTGGEAQRIFQATMDRVLQDGFAPELVEAAKHSTLADRISSGDSVGGIADLTGYTYGIVGEHNRDEDARLAALTPAALQAAARKYLSTPNVVGHLTPNESPASGSQKANAAVSDNFSGRVPSGPIVIPAAYLKELRTPTTARSKLAPVAFTLPNGLRVVVQQKSDRRTVTIGGSIAGSAAFAPSGKEGIARLASTLANFGTQHYDFTALRKIADDTGASIDLGESFSAHGLARDFPTLLAVLADGVRNPTFPDSWLTQERSQLASTVGNEQHSSGVLLDQVYLSRLLQPNDPALRVATPDTISSISRDDLIAYTQKYWRPDLTTIAIVGDVTPAQARSAVESAFGSWQRSGPAPSVQTQPLAPAHIAHGFIGTAASQLFVQLGAPALSRTSKDFDTFRVLAEILGGNGYFQSRLWQELRQKRGLVYSVGTQIKSDPDRGDLEIDFSAQPQNATAAIDLIRSQMSRLRTAPVSADELAQAKLRLVSEALLSEGSASGQLDEVLDIGKNQLPVNYYSTLEQRYQHISPADVQRVAREYLHPDKMIEIFAGPQGPWSEGPL
ncbi:MAG TPA: insulinase family protein, partial [Candidatus Baltobacteraceae bacterium]|nr:insulinase family protein [Candidatus Baltobacteraceae bacterium]